MFHAKEDKSVVILMRTRNRQGFLPRALESVLAQTHSDWHLALVNDGGDAASLERVLEPFRARLGDRISLLHHAKTDPTNIAGPLNQGIRSSKSAFLAVHDDDDSWEPAFLEKCLLTLEDSRYAACVTRSNLIWEKAENGRFVETGREIYNGWIGSAIPLFRLAESNVLAPISMVFRRAVLDDIGLRREDLGPLEDWEFNLRLFSRHPVAFLPEALSNYHQRTKDSSEGTNANFFHSHSELYGKLDTQIRNELLRKDLAEGRFGLGFLVNVSAAHGQLFGKIHSIGVDLDTRLSER